MSERAVFLERSWADIAGAIGLFHYAVKVHDDNNWHELQGSSTGFSSSGSSLGGDKRNTVNGKYDGEPRRSAARNIRFKPALKLVGSTYKSDEQIKKFNLNWMKENPCYDALLKNCQKYASDLIRYLCGPSFKMDMPFASTNAYAYGAGSHDIYKDGYYQSRGYTGKAGAQVGYLAAEAEGPSAGVEITDGRYGAVDAALFRVEGKLLGVCARVEPNINTGGGYTDGQFRLKLLGFGFTMGKGLGIHTPFGSFGFGRF